MIRLTINPEAEPTTLIFDKSVVVIGSGLLEGADVSLLGEDLQAQHIKIMKHGADWLIHNTANDPFSTLNGYPFAKKQLHHHDVLQVGNTTIVFESEFAPETRDEWYDTENTLPQVLEEVIASTVSSAPKSPTTTHQTGVYDYPSESSFGNERMLHEDASAYMGGAGDEEDNDEDEEAADLDIEAMMNEVERLSSDEGQITSEEEDHEETFIAPPPLSRYRSAPRPQEKRLPVPQESPSYTPLNPPVPPTAALPPATPTPRPTLKDYYLSEFDDENEGFKNEKDADSAYPSLEPQRNWRLLAFMIVALMFVMATIFAGFYLSLTGRSEKEELIAAEGVADVAMALTYAQLHHINPHKQHWSDPDFLKNNLSVILASNYPTLATIDSHGQFSNCPYILRIYTSTDLSQFLVIAQPEPSLMHWLIPKTSIIVDSRAMELRKLTDIKTLNRLLVNANTLDGTNATEVSNIAKLGELIPLSTLISKKGSLGFITPTALGLLRPGAENRIYNASRYYYFGESILKKALSLSESAASSNEVLHFKKQIEPFVGLNDLVLYSSQGMQIAMEQQKALATLAPLNKFLIAYLVFNSKGMISGSHLLIDDDNSKVAAINRQRIADNEDSETKMVKTFTYAMETLHNPQLKPPVEEIGEPEVRTFASGVESNHPLFMRLTALREGRQKTLKPLADKIAELLDKENQTQTPLFHEKFHELMSQYEAANKEEEGKVCAGIVVLYMEHGKMPLSQFIEFVKATELEPFFQDRLNELQTQSKFQQAVSQYEISLQLEKIKEALNLEELADKVRKTNEMLTLDYVVDSGKLINYQNELRSQVETALGRFLLTQETKLSPDSFTSKTRASLQEILKTSWITDPEEHEFYLSEFDVISQKPN